MYFTYVDWTTEEYSRPFYVGKGNLDRVCDLHRNAKHEYVADHFGQKRDIVFQCENEFECFQEEVRLIAEYHTFVDDPEASKIACNFTTGGEGSSPSKEIRQKISKALKGIKRSPEFCAQISQRMKGKPIFEFGHKQSTDHLTNRVNSFKKNRINHKHTNQTQHKLNQQLAEEIRYCLNQGEIVGDLANFYNVSETTIRNIRLMKSYTGKPNKSCGPRSNEIKIKMSERQKKKWSEDDYADNMKNHLVYARSQIKSKTKSIRQYDGDIFIHEYSSIKEATEATGISNITACCKGRYKKAGGFIWKYVNDH